MRARRPGESALLLLDVVDRLVERRIRYAVIGALAASVYGAVRASMDADVVLSIGIQEAGDLQRLYEVGGLRSELTLGDAEDPVPGLLQVSDSYGNRVDLLLGLRGMDPEAFSRVVDVPFQGSTLKFIGREDFVAMKAFAGGPTDLADAARAIAADRGSLDVALLGRLAAAYGRGTSKRLERLLAG